MDIQVPTALLLAGLLVTVRISSWLVVAPPFNTRAVPAPVKVALAVALALPVAPRLADQAPAPELGPLLEAVAFQVATGLALGFVAQMLFAAIQAAGELIDLMSGFTLASLYDPLSNVSSSMFGRVHQLVAVTLLFALDGHLLMIRGLLATFQVLPVHAIGPGALAGVVTNGVTTLVVGALETSGPVLAVMFLAELALGLVGRAVPSLNVFSMSFPLKIVLTLSLATVAVSLLPGAVSHIVERIMTDTSLLDRALGG